MESPAASEWPGFTPEGYRIYETATRQIRRALASGRTYDEACDALHGLAPGLKAFVSDDFLKILVAEEHFGGNVGIDDLALALGLPSERIEATVVSLIHELNRAATALPPRFCPMISTLTH